MLQKRDICNTATSYPRPVGTRGASCLIHSGLWLLFNIYGRHWAARTKRHCRTSRARPGVGAASDRSQPPVGNHTGGESASGWRHPRNEDRLARSTTGTTARGVSRQCGRCSGFGPCLEQHVAASEASCACAPQARARRAGKYRNAIADCRLHGDELHQTGGPDGTLDFRRFVLLFGHSFSDRLKILVGTGD